MHPLPAQEVTAPSKQPRRVWRGNHRGRSADSPRPFTPSPQFPSGVQPPSASFREALGIWICQKVKPSQPAETYRGPQSSHPRLPPSLPTGHVAVKREQRKPRPLTLSDRKQKTTGRPRRGQKGRAGKKGGTMCSVSLWKISRRR